MNFSERLKQLRLERNLTQQDVATAMGVTKVTISSYERGIREPNLDMLEALGDYFNVDVNYLLGLENGSVYYLDPSIAVVAQSICTRPELKRLFEVSKDAATEDIKFVTEMLGRLDSNRNNQSSFDCQLAAHERTDIEGSEEDRKHDIDILNDDNF